MTRVIHKHALSHVLFLCFTYLLTNALSAHPDPECNLYMAPSTVDTTTLAYFTAIPLAADTTLPTSELSINLMDFDLNNPSSIIDEEDPESTLPPEYYFQTVLWHSDFLCGIRHRADGIITAVSGFGMFGTSPPSPEDDSLRSKLNSGSNIDFDLTQVFANCRKPYPENPNTVAVQRGAMTENLPLVPKTTVPIAAGSELFLELGDDFDEQEETVNVSKDAKKKLAIERAALKRADGLCTKFVSFVSREAENFTSEMASDLWDIVRNDATTDRMTRNYLPQDVKDVPHAAQYGVATLIPPKFGYSVEWLRENGMCVDMIRVRKSSIEGAGRGVFAHRTLRKGSAVALVPLLHISDSKMMNMHPTSVSGTNPTKKGLNGGLAYVDIDTIVGTQLLLNYCFSHPDSTLLLFPGGNGVNYINHSRNSPNVRVQWSRTLRDELLQMSIEELTQSSHNHAGSLVMDLVALVDIGAGEELFMDYGADYEHAWEEHIRQQSQNLEWNGYQSANTLNYANDPFRTYQEQLEEPYGTNTKIVVSWVMQGLPAGYTVTKNTQTDVEFLSSQPYRMHDEANADISIDWKDHLETFNGEYMRDCIVLKRFIDQKSQPMYTLLLLEHSLYQGEEMPFPFVLQNVPQSAIQFLDLPYTTDQHLRNAFRHSMALPDDMFPNAWKNLVKHEHDEM